MLPHINLLFLGMPVLILLDLSYLSRFWTQFEAWLAMQMASVDGLIGADDSHFRCTIKPLYNTAKLYIEALKSTWRNATAELAHKELSSPAVHVTNQSDKSVQLPKVFAFNDAVRRHVRMPCRERANPRAHRAGPTR